MITIIFEAHGTSYDNEEKRASGWGGVGLSELGKKQSKELGERYKDEHLDTVFCSDLRRAVETAEMAFSGRDIPIIQDVRLRECDYGDWTGRSSEEVEIEKASRISKPFPGGESYEDTAKRMKSFLEDLLKDYDGKKVVIIGHRATQYGLENWIKGVPLKEAVTTTWQWQPGWTYRLISLSAVDNSIP